MDDLENLRVAVVIPVYNGADFIARAARSTLEQSHRPAEVIVVDDGSTDRTLDALAEFGNAVHVISIPNGGVSNARNIGIRASDSQFVAFLDADDVWERDKLRHQLQAFVQWPELGFSCCDFLMITPDGTSSSHFGAFRNDPGLVFDQPLPGSALPQLIKRNFVGTSSNVVVRRDVLDRAGLFDPRFRQAEDYDLWLRCAFSARFLLQSAPLVKKFGHDGNLTNNWLETLECHEQVLIALTEHAAFPSDCRPTIAPALAAVRHDIGNQEFERGMVLKAFNSYVTALATDISIANLYKFIRTISRKTIRLLSFGTIPRSRMRKGQRWYSHLPD
jgi:glycosyltransferase involved in cell wall biosynthesis